MPTGNGVFVFPALEALIARMETGLAGLEEKQDTRRYFHETYLRTTRAVGGELKRDGFGDPGWVKRLASTKVAELTKPGPVLLPLAAGGFGVTLPDGRDTLHDDKGGG